MKTFLRLERAISLAACLFAVGFAIGRQEWLKLAACAPIMVGLIIYSEYTYRQQGRAS